jgi:hypothetical protein
VFDTNDGQTLVLTAKISIELPPPQQLFLPKRVMGIHERDGKWYYAVMELDGTVKETRELRIDRHVDPANGAKPNGDNYAFAVANAIVAKAWAWEAHIGIEDTLWKKAQPSLSRIKNRSVFSSPTKRIITETAAKSNREGMLPLREISNVSPVRDCANCHARQAETSGERSYQRVSDQGERSEGG